MRRMLRRMASVGGQWAWYFITNSKNFFNVGENVFEN